MYMNREIYLLLILSFLLGCSKAEKEVQEEFPPSKTTQFKIEDSSNIENTTENSNPGETIVGDTSTTSPTDEIEANGIITHNSPS